MVLEDISDTKRRVVELQDEKDALQAQLGHSAEQIRESWGHCASTTPAASSAVEVVEV